MLKSYPSPEKYFHLFSVVRTTFFCRVFCLCNTVYVCVLCRVFGTSMVEEYEEIADSQYPSERLEYLDEDYGKMVICYVFEWEF